MHEQLPDNTAVIFFRGTFMYLYDRHPPLSSVAACFYATTAQSLTLHAQSTPEHSSSRFALCCDSSAIETNQCCFCLNVLKKLCPRVCVCVSCDEKDISFFFFFDVASLTFFDVNAYVC